MVTVHDVAARSGVSIATVSRTIRAPHRVTESTRDRVLEAIRELGYRPNRAAAGLRGGRTGTIALVVPDIDNPYFSSLTKGAQASSRARGYGLVVVDTTELAQVELDEIEAVAPQIDGLILVSSRLDEAALAEVAAEHRCVLVNRTLEGQDETTPTVTVDEGAAARAAVEHLAELGHRQVAYVGGPARSWSQTRRLRGIRDAAAVIDGFAVTDLGAFEPTAQGGRAAAQAALDSGATAVIAYNDLAAMGLLARWAELGVRVPDDVSLVGFDNTYVAELSAPHLTSVGADLREVGETAVELLMERIDGAAAATPAHGVHRELGAQLWVRGSTGAPRA
ncbi:LacI family DNA-binding transcriptional regulator [Agromyces larvae]|uniref:LacI family transcriptional regulator n=1 Tax=Agromyces larvae TaxID=2929802 RepID=A0ABY4BX18_9MICO|nr:LacI family DNA-binding transcriptional regulator [Agromyces larvae]UOE43464.1 LacI family transcriptional regulator [Agromyces larvae]